MYYSKFILKKKIPQKSFEKVLTISYIYDKINIVANDKKNKIKMERCPSGLRSWS